MTSNYMLISNQTAYNLSKFVPATHKLLLEGSTTFCIMKVALTILTLGAPLVLALSWDGAVALKNKITSSPTQQNTDQTSDAQNENSTKADDKSTKVDSTKDKSTKTDDKLPKGKAEKVKDFVSSCLHTAYNTSKSSLSVAKQGFSSAKYVLSTGNNVLGYFLPDWARHLVITTLALQAISKTIGLNSFFSGIYNYGGPAVKVVGTHVVIPFTKTFFGTIRDVAEVAKTDGPGAAAAVGSDALNNAGALANSVNEIVLDPNTWSSVGSIAVTATLSMMVVAGAVGCLACCKFFVWDGCMYGLNSGKERVAKISQNVSDIMGSIELKSKELRGQVQLTDAEKLERQDRKNLRLPTSAISERGIIRYDLYRTGGLNREHLDTSIKKLKESLFRKKKDGTFESDPIDPDVYKRTGRKALRTLLCRKHYFDNHQRAPKERELNHFIEHGVARPRDERDEIETSQSQIDLKEFLQYYYDRGRSRPRSANRPVSPAQISLASSGYSSSSSRSSSRSSSPTGSSPVLVPVGRVATARAASPTGGAAAARAASPARSVTSSRPSPKAASAKKRKRRKKRK